MYIQFRTVAGGLVFSTLAVGLQHSCGIAAGKAYCWGSNSHGQLGIGATEPSRNVPTVVVGSEHYDSIAAGAQHTCAVASGRVFCWGEDSYGQLGDGRFVGTPVLAPVAVSSDLLFTSVSAGTDHTCAITTDAALYCWGRNDSGQLGDGWPTRASVPQLVTVEGGIRRGFRPHAVRGQRHFVDVGNPCVTDLQRHGGHFAVMLAAANKSSPSRSNPVALELYLRSQPLGLVLSPSLDGPFTLTLEELFSPL